MSDEADLEDIQMAKNIVGMYKAVWVEIERQFPNCSSEERLKICSFISPLINHMCALACDENLMEDLDKATGKKKRTR